LLPPVGWVQVTRRLRHLQISTTFATRPEIRKRRTAEVIPPKTGDYIPHGDCVPFWRSDGKGKRIGIPRTLSGDDRLRRIATGFIPADLDVLRHCLAAPLAEVR